MPITPPYSSTTIARWTFCRRSSRKTSPARMLTGMKVGGRRRLVIPPQLGYGSRGAGGVIKPNETLVFVVDLIGLS